MPKDLREKLLPFQVQGVQFGIRKECRMLFADDMGVGKTVQAIALASCYEDSWPLIIVVPASLRLSWANELEKWLPGLLPSDIHVIFSSDDKLSLRQSHLHASSLSSSSLCLCNHKMPCQCHIWLFPIYTTQQEKIVNFP